MLDNGSETDDEWYRASTLPLFSFDVVSAVIEPSITSIPLFPPPLPLKQENVTNDSDLKRDDREATASRELSRHVIEFKEPDHLLVSGIEQKVREMVSRTTSENKRRTDGHSSGGSVVLSEVLEGAIDKVSCLKSLEDKVEFLTSAMDRMDTNLVTCAVLHMRDTLSRRLFHRELVNRPVAVDAYINYLRLTGQTDLMLDFLTMTGRPEDAAIAKLKHCLLVSGVETRVRMLRNCRQNFFSATDLLEFWGSLIEDEATLLERQLPIEEDDRRMESQPTCEYNAKFLEIPRKPLLELPVITTLFYCCLYHWDLPENYLSSPASIRKTFNLSEKQFVWTALAALSMRKRWDLVDSLFQGKSWLGIRKSRFCLPYHEIAATVLRYEAPPEVVSKYAVQIEDLDTRKQFAEQHNLTKVLKSCRKGS